MTLNEKLLSTPKLFSRENDIINWGIDRSIIGDYANGTFEGQQEKTRQEWQEWKDNHSKDDVGDLMVTLMMGLALHGTTVSEQVCWYYDAGTDLGWDYNDFPEDSRKVWLDFFLSQSIKAYMNNNAYIYENSAHIVHCLHSICTDYGWTLEECIEVAYQDIKDRKGLMMSGMFIKQSNLDTLEELGITHDKELQAFTGTIYCDKTLKRADEVFYNLGITYTTTGDYSSGVLVESTGKV